MSAMAGGCVGDTPGGASDFSGDALRENLVQQIKDMQRNNLEGKEQWIAYTDLHGQGKRDPNKHGADFLQAFLTYYGSGARLALHEDAGIVVELVKMMLDKSVTFKNVWSQHCMQHGEGNLEPTHHGPAFHVTFLDTLAQRANAVDKQLGEGVGMIAEGPVAKRKRSDAGPTMAPGGAVKDQLVSLVKEYQRQGEENVQLWRMFCESNNSPILDPARHDIPLLQQFVQSYISTEDPSSWAFPSPASPNWWAGAMPMTATLGMDFEKEVLINKVKTFQRGGEQQKEVWYSFCGRWRDPAKHEPAKLREFLDSVGMS